MNTLLTAEQLDEGAVTRLLERVGMTGATSLTRLAGGANNRVYRVDAPARSVALKSYFRHPDDRRDRFGAEWAFATAAWQIGARCLPEPLACDPQHQMAMFEFIPGRKLQPHEVTRDRVGEALQFYLLLIPPRQEIGLSTLPDGSEACFKLRDHLHCLERRIDRLREIVPTSHVDQTAAEFVSMTLRPLSLVILERATAAAASLGLSLDDELAHRDRCVSPSDFGFHNALLAPDGRMKFIDFEYAGWDDPAKTICDFLCQPELPVPQNCVSFLCDEILRRLDDLVDHRRRVELLLPVYRLKWCCIMLNDFLAAGNLRRCFAGSADGSVGGTERKRQQLEKARQAAEQVRHSYGLLPSHSSPTASAA